MATFSVFTAVRIRCSLLGAAQFQNGNIYQRMKFDLSKVNVNP